MTTMTTARQIELPVMRRARSASLARLGHRTAFFAVVVLSPFRARLGLVTRRTPPIYGDFTDFLLFASEVALLALLALWVVERALMPRPLDVGPRFLAWPAAALVAIMALGIPFAEDPALALSTVVHFVALVAFALYVLAEVRGLRDLVWPVSVMVAVQSIVGIGQVIAQESLHLERFGEHVLSPSLGVSVVTTRSGERVLRAYGLSDHPNILGGLLAFAVILVAGAFLMTHISEWATLLLPIAALGGAALFVTFSRGAWLGAVGGLTVLTAMVGFGPHRVALARLGIVAVAIALAIAPFVVGYHDVITARTHRPGSITTEARSVDEREALTTMVGKIIGKNPLVGVGAGGLPFAERHAEPDFRYDYQPAPSVLVDVTAETGVFGGLAALVLAVAPWVAVVRQRACWTTELATASAALSRSPSSGSSITTPGGTRLVGSGRGCYSACGLARTNGPEPREPTVADLLFVPVLLAYVAIVLALFVYGVNFLYLTFVAVHARRGRHWAPDLTEWPTVTVQLPIYNEMYVAARLIDKVADARLSARPARHPGARRLDRRDGVDRGGACRPLARPGGADQVPAPNPPRRLQGGRAASRDGVEHE